jgi:hypothetical protein
MLGPLTYRACPAVPARASSSAGFAGAGRRFGRGAQPPSEA